MGSAEQVAAPAALTSEDRKALRQVEVEFKTTGDLSGAYTNLLKEWHNAGLAAVNADRDRQAAWISELSRTGVLPLLGLERLKAKTADGTKVTAGNLQSWSETDNNPLLAAADAEAARDFPLYRPPQDNAQVKYEDTAHVADFEREVTEGRAAAESAYALNKADARGRLLFDKLSDCFGKVSAASIREALFSLDSTSLTDEERQAARTLWKKLDDRDPALADLIKDCTACGAPAINKENLEHYLTFHPRVGNETADIGPPTKRRK
jgi:hypothetical protein